MPTTAEPKATGVAAAPRPAGRPGHTPPRLDFRPSLRPAGNPASATTLLSVAMAAALLLVACGPTLRDDGGLPGRAQLQPAPATAPQPSSDTATPADAPRRVATAPAYLAEHRDPALHRSDSAAAPAQQWGNITAIDPIRSDPTPTSGAGLVIGGVLGGVLGNQIGGGDGRKAAAVLGAVGGAVAGNNVERLRSREVVGYRVQLQLDNGQQRSVTLRQRGDFGTGDRVRLVSGKLQRA